MFIRVGGVSKVAGFLKQDFRAIEWHKYFPLEMHKSIYPFSTPNTIQNQI